jgi:hypothetical protein
VKRFTAPADTSPSPRDSRPWRRSLVSGLGLALARLRFFLLLGGAVLVVAAWPSLRGRWDRLTGPPGADAAVSPDTEYWCPMCPGVVSDWPGPCPVCHMALVRRQKGEMTPLPDGVVARVQLSPYRVQLAGIRTAPVEFRPLVHEVALAGLLSPASERADDLTRLTLADDVSETDTGLLHVGQQVEVTSEAFVGRTFPARVKWLAPQLSLTTRSLGVRLEVDNPLQELRPGMFAAARVAVPVADLAVCRRAALERWRHRTAVGLCVSASVCPMVPPPGGLGPLLESAIYQVALHGGLVPAVPESAVIDTGTRKVVFVQQMPGMFDAVEVRLGRRGGAFFPVLAGLEPGQVVVAAGAFLLDAETRLNPAAGATYFGAGGRSATPGATHATPTPPSDTSPDDRRLIERQKICPVTGQELGSMGEPVRVVVEGRVIFLCCDGCAPALRKDPKKYLAKLPR